MDVNKLVQLFQRFNVFDHDSSDLVAITNGDIATEDVKNDLLSAETTGKDLVTAFINNRLSTTVQNSMTVSCSESLKHSNQCTLSASALRNSEVLA